MRIKSTIRHTFLSLYFVFCLFFKYISCPISNYTSLHNDVLFLYIFSILFSNLICYFKNMIPNSMYVTGFAYHLVPWNKLIGDYCHPRLRGHNVFTRCVYLFACVYVCDDVCQDDLTGATQTIFCRYIVGSDIGGKWRNHKALSLWCCIYYRHTICNPMVCADQVSGTNAEEHWAALPPCNQ